jgi:hypothetical protein
VSPLFSQALFRPLFFLDPAFDTTPFFWKENPKKTCYFLLGKNPVLLF